MRLSNIVRGRFSRTLFALWLVFATCGVIAVSSNFAFSQGDDPVADAQNQPAGGTAPTDTGDPTNYLEWAHDALGNGYSIIFLSLSFTLVALVVMNVLTARRENVCPMALLEGFEIFCILRIA